MLTFIIELRTVASGTLNFSDTLLQVYAIAGVSIFTVLLRAIICCNMLPSPLFNFTQNSKRSSITNHFYLRSVAHTFVSLLLTWIAFLISLSLSPLLFIITSVFE